MEIYLIALSFIAWALVWSDLRNDSKNQKKSFWRLYVGFFAVGILAWVKSPLYSVFFVVGYFLLLIAGQRWSEFKRVHFYGSLAFGALVGASWYLAVMGVDYDRFIAQYMVRETFGKSGGNGGTAFQLWTALGLFSIPFTLLALASWWGLWKSENRRVLEFVVGAGIPAATFFSLYPYRVTTYLYVLIPLLAILVALFEMQNPRVFAWISRTTAGLMTVAVSYLVWLMIRTEALTSWSLLFAVLVGILVCVVWLS